MLADRLAGKSDFDTQQERRTMELLKLRFGEANLHNAEIMLGVCPQCPSRLEFAS
jgi:anaphase-promoting complex subunit 2